MTTPAFAGGVPGRLPLSGTILPIVRLARANALGLAVGFAALLLVLDFLTGEDTPALVVFTLLFLGPISIVAWCAGRAPGIVVAALCTCGAIAIDVTGHLHRGHPLRLGRMGWNEGGSLVIFVFCVEIVARLRAYERKEARERHVTVDQLRQAERLGVVGKLAAGLAHELGTPLNVILGYAELLQSDTVTKPRVKAASTAIVAQTEKMTTILRGLLDFSRRAGGERSAVPLGALVETAATLLRPVARKNEIEIEVDVAYAGESCVYGNPTELEQVLVNLMMNGIQAMQQGGTLRVRVGHALRDASPLESPSVACVEVEDQGTGISPEALPQIFDPFFTTKDVGAGTGLGLSISYGIVSDHGGRIQVSSSLGSGSRFSVYLPLARLSP